MADRRRLDGDARLRARELLDDPERSLVRWNGECRWREVNSNGARHTQLGESV